MNRGVSSRLPRALTVAGIILYLLISVDHLSVFPPVGEDEPWIAAAPYKLATDGVYGSDLFTGYYGNERHNYQHMPVYPLLQAGLFKAFGAGVLQMRLLPVAFGLALLIVVFVVGRQIGDERVGALAVLLMLALRISDGGEGTGILLLDRARISRYDIAVPVFGLLAFWAFARAEGHRAYWCVATGVLTGLASLSHLFGVFWLPVFFGLLALDRRGGGHAARGAALITIGFVAACLPWAVYVASGWADYLGQMRPLATRFDVFNPRFYIDNLIRGDGPISLDWLAETVRELPLLRPGSWILVLGLPLAVGIVLWGTRRNGRHLARWLALAALTELVLFAALLRVKTVNYMIGLWPLGALLLAWAALWVWDRAGRTLRIALIALLGALLVEGGARIVHQRESARRAIPYDWYESEIARCIPAQSLVLGLQHYWLGLRQYPYRTWLLPANLANPRFNERAVPLDEALDRIDPDIILIDRHMTALFDEAVKPDHPNHHLYVGFTRFMTRRRAEIACVVQNRTYGTMTVYRYPRTRCARCAGCDWCDRFGAVRGCTCARVRCYGCGARVRAQGAGARVQRAGCIFSWEEHHAIQGVRHPCRTDKADIKSEAQQRPILRGTASSEARSSPRCCDGRPVRAGDGPLYQRHDSARWREAGRRRREVL